MEKVTKFSSALFLPDNQSLVTGIFPHEEPSPLMSCVLCSRPVGGGFCPITHYEPSTERHPERNKHDE